MKFQVHIYRQKSESFSWSWIQALVEPLSLRWPQQTVLFSPLLVPFCWRQGISGHVTLSLQSLASWSPCPIPLCLKSPSSSSCNDKRNCIFRAYPDSRQSCLKILNLITSMEAFSSHYRNNQVSLIRKWVFLGTVFSVPHVLRGHFQCTPMALQREGFAHPALFQPFQKPQASFSIWPTPVLPTVLATS